MPPPFGPIPGPVNSAILPPVTVVCFSVNSPVSATATRRNEGALAVRRIVLPFPSMVIVEVITGNPFAPSVSLFTLVKVWILFVGSMIVSAPLPAGQPPVAVSVLAAVMALRLCREF